MNPASKYLLGFSGVALLYSKSLLSFYHITDYKIIVRYWDVTNPDGGFQPRRRLNKALKNKRTVFIQPPSGFATADGVVRRVR